MDAVPPPSQPRERGSPVYDLPLQSQGPEPFFPPVCLKTHWDPTAILRHTLPEGYLSQPLDPRPWTRICLSYTTAGGDPPAAPTNPSVVLPAGGQFGPPDRYQRAIDQESQLRRLDRPLGTCEGNQWEPSLRSDMYDARQLVPRHVAPSDPSRIQEVAYPRALLRSGPYECRAADDRMNVALASDYMFNNATKQDRYKLMNKPAKPEAPKQDLRGVQGAGGEALTKDATPVREYERMAAEQRAFLMANAVAPTPK